MANGKNDERMKYSFIFHTKKERNVVLALLGVLLLGYGPGSLIANQPKFIFGIPMLWAWWLLWYVVWVILMYFLIFKSGRTVLDD